MLRSRHKLQRRSITVQFSLLMGGLLLKIAKYMLYWYHSFATDQLSMAFLCTYWKFDLNIHFNNLIYRVDLLSIEYLTTCFSK